MNRPKHIPWIIILIGCGFLALTAWSVFRADQDTSAVTDRDYYSHGLRYNETLLEKKAAEALGWSLATQLNGQTLMLTLTDKAGQPIRGARGTISLYLHGDTNITVFPLQEVASGVYQFKLTRRMSGEISLLGSLVIFVLAVLVGFEVISKVPATLHTPLMSGANSIHGIVVIGGMIIAAEADDILGYTLAFVAVVFGAMNVVGGYVVTDRMLQMFKKKPTAPKADGKEA